MGMKTRQPKRSYPLESHTPKWEPDTYRKGGEVRSWSIKLPFLRVTVHRMLGLDGWFVSCHNLNIDGVRITHDNESRRPEELQQLGVEVLNKTLDTVLESLVDAGLRRGKDGP
jgi:hypothetical protein